MPGYSPSKSDPKGGFFRFKPGGGNSLRLRQWRVNGIPTPVSLAEPQTDDDRERRLPGSMSRNFKGRWLVLGQREYEATKKNKGSGAGSNRRHLDFQSEFRLCKSLSCMDLQPVRITCGRFCGRALHRHDVLRCNSRREGQGRDRVTQRALSCFRIDTHCHRQRRVA